ADKAFVLDDRAMLQGAVVVAGDGSGANVDALSDFGIADIGEVVGLRATAEPARLDLDEVADVHLVAQLRARPQPGVGAKPAVGADIGILELRERMYFRTVADGDVAQHAVGTDAHAAADPDPPFEHAIDVDRHIAPALERTAHIDARRV